VETIPESKVQRKLLVVDDQRPVLETLGALLTSAGYRVVCVPSGAGALAAARLASFDAALIDIFMPEMDGFETAIRLREQCDKRGRTIRTWHITGMNSPAVESRSAQCGMMGLILKPFDLADLCKVLEAGFTAPVPPPGTYVPPTPVPKPRTRANGSQADNR
jgi:CheY-like chemotaxis protein